MVTLKDVAKRAGVSVSTASYSINGSSLITKETKQKVLLAAKEIGYRTNGPAKNLKEKKTNIIGLFLSGFTGPFFTDMMEGIQDVVIQNGYELMVYASDDNHRLLVERYVDGAIILNHHMEDSFLKAIADEKLPCVVLDREIKTPFINHVLLPNEQGSAMAVRYLLEKGHNRIGYMAGSRESYDGEMRLKGFKTEMKKYNRSFSRKDLLRADFTESSGYLAMSQYIEKRTQDVPTAFICANDEMAMGAIRAIKEKNLKIPDDIAIVGFDDIYVSKHFSPSITTIKVPRKEWGTIAAQSLFKMMDSTYDAETMEAVSVELMSRTSG
ncbi:LacI family DNA-binding transcriptional regulator [Fictibacillus phosphorivorans]|uniref:LacI family DNA-binding transcriptional regulator n=1 Tax=Fictibacillus phosphorivorans TaxID=1221500 RepID=UPI002040A30D|nr:LacI family DNA-binding transcriptional regulator [Fictibacillus phosphorivorans]MCM3720212.1 LacI family transcriptional regulator [Fictibacillus phosphorivorans]MCM3777901.1 LacI family transcriptional regulator [Fictibacillus phosphorivorans]